jgi:hypothetical protein
VALATLENSAAVAETERWALKGVFRGIDTPLFRLLWALGFLGLGMTPIVLLASSGLMERKSEHFQGVWGRSTYEIWLLISDNSIRLKNSHLDMNQKKLLIHEP